MNRFWHAAAGGAAITLLSLATPAGATARAATGAAGRPIPVGGHYPRLLASTPDGKTVYAVNEGSGPQSSTVTPIRTATNQADPAIPLGGSPNAIAITPDGKTAYLAVGSYLIGSDPDGDWQAGPGYPGRGRPRGDRDRAGREDGLRGRDELRDGSRHGDPDRDRNQPCRRPNPGGNLPQRRDRNAVGVIR